MILNPTLTAISLLMEGLSAMLGPQYEIILHDLHDLNDLSHTVVRVAGNITERTIGSPATNYLCEILNKYGHTAPNSINYRNVTSKGQIIRSSTIFIRDEKERIIGSLCLNQDLTVCMEASRLLQALTAFNSHDGSEIFHKDIIDVKITAEKILADYPLQITFQKKKDRMKQMRELNKLGFFELTDSVKLLAQHFGINPATIYLYLREIKNLKA